MSRYAAIALPGRVLDGADLAARKVRAMAGEHSAVIGEAARSAAA